MVDIKTLKDADTEIGKIQNKQSKLESQLSTLNKQRETLLVDAGKGYFCKTCKKYEETRVDLSSELCYSCLIIQRQKTFKKDTLKKLYGAKIKDITTSGFTIESVTVNRDGKSTMLSVYADYDGDCCEGNIEITDEWKEEWTGNELRPCEKTRREKPLPM